MKIASFIAGLSLTAVLGYAALAEPTYLTAPDPALTPGKVAATDQSEVCGLSSYPLHLTYSQAHRATTPALKDWIFREYGITPPHGSARADWEIDHLIPLCLGGADEAANLWPQPSDRLVGVGFGFESKDKIEAAACRAVCRGGDNLQDVQSHFLNNWRERYGEIGK